MSRAAADLRAWWAAVIKEWRTIRRYPTLIPSLLFWPVLLPAVYVLMGQVYSGGDPQALDAFASRAGTGEVAGFVFVGFAMYLWLSILLWGPGTALRQEQLRGSLEAVFLTPASRFVVLFGAPVAHLAVTFADFAVMVLALRWLFGTELAPDAIARAAVVIAVAVPAMYVIAAIFATGVLKLGEVGPIVQLVRGALVLLCGITYPVVMLPGWAQALSALLPTTYVVADVRRVLLSGSELSAVASDLAVLLVLTGAAAVGCFWLFRWTERQARRTGMLGRY